MKIPELGECGSNEFEKAKRALKSGKPANLCGYMLHPDASALQMSRQGVVGNPKLTKLFGVKMLTFHPIKASIKASTLRKVIGILIVAGKEELAKSVINAAGGGSSGKGNVSSDGLVVTIIGRNWTAEAHLKTKIIDVASKGYNAKTVYAPMNRDGDVFFTFAGKVGYVKIDRCTLAQLNEEYNEVRIVSLFVKE